MPQSTKTNTHISNVDPSISDSFPITSHHHHNRPKTEGRRSVIKDAEAVEYPSPSLPPSLRPSVPPSILTSLPPSPPSLHPYFPPSLPPPPFLPSLPPSLLPSLPPPSLPPSSSLLLPPSSSLPPPPPSLPPSSSLPPSLPPFLTYLDHLPIKDLLPHLSLLFCNIVFLLGLRSNL